MQLWRVSHGCPRTIVGIESDNLPNIKTSSSAPRGRHFVSLEIAKLGFERSTFLWDLNDLTSSVDF